MPREGVTWGQRLGWAFGDTGLNLFWQTVSTFLYFFYTDTLGISPFWAGVAFGVGSFWDGLFDPIMGAIADRTRSRHGRFRPYILYLSAPCGIALVLAFTAPPLTGSWLIAYAMATHVVLRTLMTTIGLAYGALSARLATDSNERSALASLRMVAAAAGAFCVSMIVPRLLVAHDDPRTAYLFATCILGAAATTILLICFATTREAIDPDLDDEIPPAHGVAQVMRRFGRDMLSFWGMLRHNLPLRMLFLAITVSSIMGTMFGKCMVYWYKYDLKDMGVMALAMSLPVPFFLVSAPLWGLLSRRTSKRAVWLAGAVLGALVHVAFYLLNPRDHVVLLTLLCALAVTSSAGAVMFWAMLPDTVEYNEWKLGQRAEARIFGFAGLAQKVALAINAVILGQVLEWIGFAPGREQTPETLSALLKLMCVVPFAGAVIIVGLMWRYPLDAKRHGEIVEQIRLRASRHRADRSGTRGFEDADVDRHRGDDRLEAPAAVASGAKSPPQRSRP